MLGLIISLSLSLLCLWRLLVFVGVLVRYKRFISRIGTRWRAAVCWCLDDEGESAVLLSSPSVAGPPKSLLRKVAFHAALFMAVAVDVPSWAVLLSRSLHAGGDPTAVLSGPPPVLYLLHLLSYPFTFAALAILLDMWLMVAEFDPHRMLRVWRALVLLAGLAFVLLLGMVATQDFMRAEARTAAQVAGSRACQALVMFSAGVLLGLALTFLIAGCMIQQRIINVFGRHTRDSSAGGGDRGGGLAWINLLALLRLNAVALTCLISFALRSVDIFLLNRAGKDYYQGFLECTPGGWLGLTLCYGRWVLQALPVLALLYIMRNTGDASTRRLSMVEASMGEKDHVASYQHLSLQDHHDSNNSSSSRTLSSLSGNPHAHGQPSVSSNNRERTHGNMMPRAYGDEGGRWGAL